jgi:hypothetical protein
VAAERGVGLAPFERTFLLPPSAVNSTIWARHTCFWGLFRSAKIAQRRRRSRGLTSMQIPVRIS